MGSTPGSRLDRVAERLGADVLAAVPVAGGDTNEAHHVTLADGRELFVKTNAHAPPGLFGAEARGLRALADTGAVRVPDVVLVEDAPPAATAFLVLEWIPSARPAADHDEEVGHALATLHRTPCGAFGLDHDNYLATLPQHNEACPTWTEFVITRRFEPLVRRATNEGRLDPALRPRFDALYARLASLFAPEEPPSLLHGDLWAGNAMTDAAGRPVFVDPAVYGGHREMDLAMMQLFGGFGARVFAAYDDVHPRAAGHASRVELFQLYPLLVHVCLFGGSYAAAVRRVLDRYS